MSYQNLQVYQRAHAFGVACHALTMKLPKYELFETGSQLRRSAKSISANIVEGYGRKAYPADEVRFLAFALASNDDGARSAEMATATWRLAYQAESRWCLGSEAHKVTNG